MEIETVRIDTQIRHPKMNKALLKTISKEVGWAQPMNNQQLNYTLPTQKPVHPPFVRPGLIIQKPEPWKISGHLSKSKKSRTAAFLPDVYCGNFLVIAVDGHDRSFMWTGFNYIPC